MRNSRATQGRADQNQAGPNGPRRSRWSGLLRTDIEGALKAILYPTAFMVAAAFGWWGLWAALATGSTRYFDGNRSRVVARETDPGKYWGGVATTGFGTVIFTIVAVSRPWRRAG